ncbi:MAG: hypothetical protein Q7T71_04590, partial [Herbiconiux sp.]|nr:hypothetical protein [Herbiconiux sp.]
LGVEAGFQRALESAPEAERWGRRFLDRNDRWREAEVTARQTHATIAMAVDGIRSACRDYPDERLHSLLASTIALSERFVAAANRERTSPAVTRDLGEIFA